MALTAIDPAGCAVHAGRRWPVIEGIAYVRAGREDLADAALDALDAGDRRRALALLLTDQDEWAPVAAPSLEDAAEVIDRVDAGGSARAAMTALAFGPVTDYFAHRQSDATFLSGLGLLARAWPDAAAGERPRVVELACGIGQLLREAVAFGAGVVGVDVVFAKLWLARRFVVPDAVLVCADVSAGALPLPAGAADLAFCHDAAYFLPDKPAAVAELRRLVDDGGAIALGHCHNALVDNLSAGRPLDPAGWAALVPGADLYDDEELAAAWLADGAPTPSSPDALAGAAAVALIAAPACVAEDRTDSGFLQPKRVPSAPPAIGSPVPGRPLRLNPLYAPPPPDVDPVPLQIRWPSARYEAEYASLSDHLRHDPVPSAALERAAAGEIDGEVAALARRRIVVDLPERW